MRTKPSIWYAPCGSDRYPCLCCGYLTLGEKPPGTFLICDVCGWEDDMVQYRDPCYEGGANKVSLKEARLNFSTFGASEKRCLKFVRPPLEDEKPLLAFKDLDPVVRSNAARALGQIGQKDIALLPDLIRAMNDELWRVRVNAAYAVYRTDCSKWDIVLPLLTEALNHENDHVRSDVVDVLGDIKAPIQDVMPLLVKALNDEAATVRVQISEALADMNPPPKDMVPALIAALDDTDTWVRRCAASALGQIGDPAAVPMLIKNLTHRNPEVGEVAIDALKKIATPEALKAVKEFDSE